MSCRNSITDMGGRASSAEQGSDRLTRGAKAKLQAVSACPPQNDQPLRPRPLPSSRLRPRGGVGRCRRPFVGAVYRETSKFPRLKTIERPNEQLEDAGFYTYASLQLYVAFGVSFTVLASHAFKMERKAFNE